MNEPKELNKSNQVEKQSEETEDRPEAAGTDGEFKVTVRKLEMPVRPRGVLAE